MLCDPRNDEVVVAFESSYGKINFMSCFANLEIWGDIPSWLSAIGTVGSLAVAMWLLYEDLQDRREQRRLEREYLPRKMVSWVELRGEDSAILWVQNLSNEPAFDVVAYAGKSGTDLEGLPDAENVYIEPVFGIIPPQTKLDYPLEDKKHYQGSHFPDIPVSAIEFTDCNGNHWRRLADGKIVEKKSRRSYD